MDIKQDISANPVIWLKRGFLAFIGFLLSPLSWWNDIFINIPLAYGFAWLICKFLDLFIDVRRWLFLVIFVIGYFLTNISGFLLIHYSIVEIRDKKKYSLNRLIFIAIFYTIIIVVLAYFDIFHLPLNLDLLPYRIIK